MSRFLTKILDKQPGEASTAKSSHSSKESHSILESRSSGISPSKSVVEAFPKESHSSEKALSMGNSNTLADYALTLTYRKGDSRTNNDFLDQVLSKVKGDAQLLYFWLNRYRDSGQDITITLNWGVLEKRTHMSKTSLWRAAKQLEAEGLIVKTDYKFGRNKEQGFRFRLFLPESHSNLNSLPSAESHSRAEDIKRNIKENSKRELSNCPDCLGSGFFYPNGFEQGVKKCKHPKLKG